MQYEDKIILQNKDIIAFYNKYPFLDIEKINLRVIQSYQDIIDNMTGEFNENTIISSIKSQERQIGLLHNTINQTTESITKEITTKLYDTRKDYIRDLELLVNKNGNENLIKIIEKIEKEENKLIHKIESNQDKLGSELNNFLNQYKTASKKGELGEILLETTLTNLFPSSEILNTTGQTSSGDFILKRENKVNILFENKNYDSCNVSRKEVDKFIKDVTLQNCSGVMISQKTGIAQKNNFQIDIDNNNVLIYIHNMNYDPDKIILACDIIDNLISKLKDFNDDDDSTHIPHTLLQKITEKYQRFIAKKEHIIFQINNDAKKTIQYIKELELDEINSLFSNTIANTNVTIHRCEYCNIPYKSPKALSNHKRKCKKQPSSITETNTSISSQYQIEPEINDYHIV
jgi:hypothetical protein